MCRNNIFHTLFLERKFNFATDDIVSVKDNIVFSKIYIRSVTFTGEKLLYLRMNIHERICKYSLLAKDFV